MIDLGMYIGISFGHTVLELTTPLINRVVDKHAWPNFVIYFFIYCLLMGLTLCLGVKNLFVREFLLDEEWFAKNTSLLIHDTANNC